MTCSCSSGSYAAAGTYDEKLGHGFFSTHICSRPSVDKQVVLVAPSRLTAALSVDEILGWSRPHLDKDERNIVRRHRDKLE